MRNCGPCTLCCTLLAVPDIDKPANTRCDHICDSGCGIYEQRPWSCKRFDCLWLKGRLPIWARPDKIGVVFDEAKPRVTGKVMPLLLIERDPGAHELGRIQPLIKGLGKDREVFVVNGDGLPVLLEAVHRPEAELSSAAKAARRPLAPEELIEAKHDRVHHEPGKARPARTLRTLRGPEAAEF